MKAKKRITGRGGSGRGQGRKSIAAVAATVVIGVRATPEEKAKFTALGGSTWFRRALNRAKVSTRKG